MDVIKMSNDEFIKRMSFEFVRDNVFMTICCVPIKAVLKNRFSYKSAFLGLCTYNVFMYSLAALIRALHKEDDTKDYEIYELLKRVDEALNKYDLDGMEGKNVVIYKRDDRKEVKPFSIVADSTNKTNSEE